MVPVAAPSHSQISLVAEPGRTCAAGVVPLCDMRPGDAYKRCDGGLYGGGRNELSYSRLQAARQECAKIGPLDPAGHPSPVGLIGLAAIGFSNCWQEFEHFIRLASRDPETSPAVRSVNGAQNRMGAARWAIAAVHRPTAGDPWRVLDDRLAGRGLTAPQVQVAWMKLDNPRPAALGEFPQHAEHTADDLRVVIRTLKSRFSNLRVAYLSSRIYAGYAVTDLSPEPYAYESAFTVRWLIQQQMNGDDALGFDPADGAAAVPLLLWGPYLWASGVRGRACDGLVWRRDDFADDGTHPSAAGTAKVASLLLRFLKSDPTARPWFRR